MQITVKPNNNIMFTDEEISKFLDIISTNKGSIESRIDGLTCYSINKAPNNEKKERQFKITLSCHYTNFESFNYTWGYVETLNFFKLLKEIKIFYGI